MRKVYTAIEPVLSLMLIVLGTFMFESGYFGSPRYSFILLPVGAVFLVSGFVVLAYAIRSRVWRRRMLRDRSIPSRGPLSGLSHHS